MKFGNELYTYFLTSLRSLLFKNIVPIVTYCSFV